MVVRFRSILARAGHSHRVAPWLWFAVAYLVVVLGLLLVGGQVETPSPSDIGWADLEVESDASGEPDPDRVANCRRRTGEQERGPEVEAPQQ